MTRQLHLSIDACASFALVDRRPSLGLCGSCVGSLQRPLCVLSKVQGVTEYRSDRFGVCRVLTS